MHPRVSQAIAERYRKLPDLTSIVSDVLDEYGLPAAVGASTLRPTIPGVQIAGPAVTVRNIPRADTGAVDGTRQSTMYPFRAHDFAQSGDCIVIESFPGVSNLGAASAAMGLRRGEVGAVVFGGIRDVAATRALGFPIWSTELTPVSGRFRVEGLEVNGSVLIAGIQVNPGDLVVADETGVCFVPNALVEKVLHRCEELAAAESSKLSLDSA